MTNRGWYWYFLGNYFGVHGKARCDLANGECTVGFFGQSVEGVANYRILNTDYDNFSVIYNCVPVGTGKFEVVWVLARENTIDNSLLAKIKKDTKVAIPHYDFDKSTELTKQVDCVYTWN